MTNKQEIDFNINCYVKVKLTEVGLAELERQALELRERVPSLPKYTPPKMDGNGYSQFQMWILMNELGHLCGLGSEPPFDVDIKFIKPEEGMSKMVTVKDLIEFNKRCLSRSDKLCDKWLLDVVFPSYTDNKCYDVPTWCTHNQLRCMLNSRGFDVEIDHLHGKECVIILIPPQGK